MIGAIVAVNAVGDVRDPATGKILAGPIDRETNNIFDSISLISENYHAAIPPGTNTTIGVVAVNADLTKAEANKVAQMAQDGYARTIYPSHTMHDGDTIFAAATGGIRIPADVAGALAAKVMELAILDAVYAAESIAGIPSYKELHKEES